MRSLDSHMIRVSRYYQGVVHKLRRLKIGDFCPPSPFLIHGFYDLSRNLGHHSFLPLDRTSFVDTPARNLIGTRVIHKGRPQFTFFDTLSPYRKISYTYLSAIITRILSPQFNCRRILWTDPTMNAFRPGKRLRFASCNPTSHYLP